MGTVAGSRALGAWARPVAGTRRLTAAGLVALMVASLVLRVDGIGAHLWMDEAIAVGIAGHPLTQIPGLLRLDGSPPLYYLVLHGWMQVVGSSDVAVHWLSLVFALLCVPAGWWCGVSVGGRRVGWILAALAACCPFVTSHAQEARMYTLVVLLGLLCVGCFVNAYVRRRRGYRVGLGVTLALSLYTHNWALFLGAACFVAVVVLAWGAPRARRGALVRDALAGFGIAAVLYAPWLPTLLFQARHTGAPWATAPSVAELADVPKAVLSGLPAMLICVLAAVWLLARGDGARRGPAAILLVLSVVPVLLAWGLSQASPAWDERYLAVIIAPALALTAYGLAYGGRAGLAALVALVVLWGAASPPRERSNAFQLARAAAPLVHRGDLVVATPFAQVPLLARYLPPGLRYASALGADRDPHVVDWRDVTRRFAHPAAVGPLLARAPAGSRVLLVLPAQWDARSHQTLLGREERARADEAEQALLTSPHFTPVTTLSADVRGVPRTSTLFAVLLRVK